LRCCARSSVAGLALDGNHATGLVACHDSGRRPIRSPG
jgi:hypothetical protein